MSGLNRHTECAIDWHINASKYTRHVCHSHYSKTKNQQTNYYQNDTKIYLPRTGISPQGVISEAWWADCTPYTLICKILEHRSLVASYDSTARLRTATEDVKIQEEAQTDV